MVKTRWTVVIIQAQRGSPEARAALCNDYWYPVYAFFRRSGSSKEKALELTQGLFAHLLETDIAGADRARGKFRNWLLTMAKNYRVSDARREKALKRGGGVSHLSIGVATAEERFQAEPSHNLTPERSFDRAWALRLLEQVLDRLRGEYGEQFDKLKLCLYQENEQTHREMAAELGITAEAFTQRLSRFRKRFRELLKEEVAPTVGTDGEIDEEVRFLFEVFRAD